ncbi:MULTISPECIES: hypothetical protein [Bacillus cereus group]|uniref:hypothetical protein n=1 Tax=Bacillus cereus group TaxID=86661 RepID=UPI0008FDAFF3|nr:MULTISPECIES: hypothetical protein [Bacillus cereus group]MDG1622864.1 hypothetical protein [Bacillus mobilis]MDX5837229.1 hypothetical protein [Bacillus cereus group sp. BfR-BA-01700]OJE31268.1 hypothetical protein BAQ44_22780 [Bacillus mobilis]HDR7244383.1 hypothetical protein [Bacillus mobilis]
MSCLNLKEGSYAVVIDNSVCSYQIGEIIRFVDQEYDVDGKETDFYYTFINKNNVREQLTRDEFKPVKIRKINPKRIKF